MQMRRIAFLFLSLWAVSTSSAAWGGTPMTDIDELSESHRELYLEAKTALEEHEWNFASTNYWNVGARIDSFIELETDFLPIHVLKARFLIERGNKIDDGETANSRALSVLSKVLSRAPDHASAHVVAGIAYLNLGDFENAWKAVNRARELKSEDPGLYYHWALLLGIEKRYTEALEIAEMGLAHARDDQKILLDAMYFITQSAGNSTRTDLSYDIASVAFRVYDTPQERMAVVGTIIDELRTDKDLLLYAENIVMREKRVTPDFPEADLQLARIILTKGYKSTTREHIDQYDNTATAYAEQILLRIREDESISERASELLIDIALSNGDFEKAKEYLEAAGSSGLMSEARYKEKLGHIHFIGGNFEKSAAIYEELGYATHPIQVKAYTKIGRTEPLHAFHRRQVQKNPGHAWTLGIYAMFLLTQMDDPDGAIEYGNRALAILSYPSARHTVGLAYLVKAVGSNLEGDLDATFKHIEMAKQVGYSVVFNLKYCGKNCEDLRALGQAIKHQRAPT